MEIYELLFEAEKAAKKVVEDVNNDILEHDQTWAGATPDDYEIAKRMNALLAVIKLAKTLYPHIWGNGRVFEISEAMETVRMAFDEWYKIAIKADLDNAIVKERRLI